MGKYEHIILLSDMDGTLLNSSNKISEGNRNAIEAFTKEGGRFGVATGRCFTNALSFLEGVNLNGFFILANGCLLYDCAKQKYLAEHLLDKKALLDFLERCLNECKTLGIQIYTRDLCHIASHREYADPRILNDHFPLSYDCPREMMNLEWIKILFWGSEEDLNWLTSESTFLEENGVVTRVRFGASYLEFLPPGVSKGATVTRLKAFTGPANTIFAVGDYFNDLEMLRMADVGIAVGNAPQEVKNCAAMVCADNEHDPIADIVGRILLYK